VVILSEIIGAVIIFAISRMVTNRLHSNASTLSPHNILNISVPVIDVVWLELPSLPRDAVARSEASIEGFGSPSARAHERARVFRRVPPAMRVVRDVTQGIPPVSTV